MQQYIGFRLNDNEFTIPILKVREIINTPTVTPLPQSPHYMKGIVNLRGRIVPIVDLKELISIKGDVLEGQERGAKVIVLLTRESTFGILVDSITSVINIAESDIEPPEGFMHDTLRRIEGVAKFDDRLVILLDTDKLVDDASREIGGPHEMISDDMLAHDLEEHNTIEHVSPAKTPEAPETESPETEDDLPEFEPPALNRAEEAPAAAAPAEPDTLEKSMVNLHAARNALSQKLGDDPKVHFLNDLVTLIDAMASREFDRADEMIGLILQNTEGDLYHRIGHVTRKLHDSLKEFRNALDPRIRQITDEEVPQAVDSLEYVIRKTEEAANQTMSIVEKYHETLGEFGQKISAIQDPLEATQYLENFRDALNKDMTEIMLAQEFQDITGQTIRRVIDLVNTIEAELIGLITTFGVKGLASADDSWPEDQAPETSRKVTQNEVEDLLKEFGF